jgi:AraC family transcriptional regulator, arabinose operon regulatory protein
MLDPAKSYVNTLPITPAPPPGLLLADHFGASFGYHVRRPRGTRDWLITYTLRGEGRYRLAGQTHLCEAGDVFILEPGCSHDYATAQPAAYWEFYWAHFTPRPHWAHWLQLPVLAPGLLAQRISTNELRQRIEQSFVRLLQDSQGIGVWQVDLSANALEEILILVAQQHERMKSRPLDPRIESMLSLLNQRFRERLTVAELADTVALSPSRLAHLFKEQVGSTIMEQVISLRMRQAARLLEFTSLTVGEIAHEVGFQSQFHFARQFKIYYGRTPTEYRRQVQTSLVESADVAHM